MLIPRPSSYETPVDARRDGFIDRRGVIGFSLLAATAGGLALLPDNHHDHQNHNDHNGHHHAPRVRAYTIEDMERHIRGMGNITWTTVRELIQNNLLIRCIDGRETRESICEAGGNAGEFLTDISSLESITGHEYDEVQLERLFISYLAEHPGEFYMHTSVHAVEHVAQHLACHGRPPLPYARAEQLVRNPPRDRWEQMLDILTHADCVGCGHIKGMMTTPREYDGIRPALVRSFMRIFYKQLWSGNPKMHLSILPHDHTEGAVARIRGSEGEKRADENTRVALFKPMVNVQHNGRIITSSVFAHHDVMGPVMDDVSSRILGQITGIRGIEQALLRNMEHDRREEHLRASARALAANVGTYIIDPDPRRQNQLRVRPNAA